MIESGAHIGHRRTAAANAFHPVEQGQAILKIFVQVKSVTRAIDDEPRPFDVSLALRRDELRAPPFRIAERPDNFSAQLFRSLLFRVAYALSSHSGQSRVGTAGAKSFLKAAPAILRRELQK